jgi:hypothetical protein
MERVRCIDINRTVDNNLLPQAYQSKFSVPEYTECSKSLYMSTVDK